MKLFAQIKRRRHAAQAVSPTSASATATATAAAFPSPAAAAAAASVARLRARAPPCVAQAEAGTVRELEVERAHPPPRPRLPLSLSRRLSPSRRTALFGFASAPRPDLRRLGCAWSFAAASGLSTDHGPALGRASLGWPSLEQSARLVAGRIRSPGQGKRIVSLVRLVTFARFAPLYTCLLPLRLAPALGPPST